MTIQIKASEQCVQQVLIIMQKQGTALGPVHKFLKRDKKKKKEKDNSFEAYEPYFPVL